MLQIPKKFVDLRFRTLSEDHRCMCNPSFLKYFHQVQFLGPNLLTDSDRCTARSRRSGCTTGASGASGASEASGASGCPSELRRESAFPLCTLGTRVFARPLDSCPCPASAALASAVLAHTRQQRGGSAQFLVSQLQERTGDLVEALLHKSKREERVTGSMVERREWSAEWCCQPSVPQTAAASVAQQRRKRCGVCTQKGRTRRGDDVDKD